MKKSYRDLFIWQASVDLAVHVIELTDGFSYKRLSLADQLQRAAISVPSNIAEGQGRLTKRDQRHFLSTARGSLHELDTQLEIALRVGLITQKTRDDLALPAKRIGVGINHLMERLSLSIS
jgi:four helix bundle protein